MDKQRVLVTGGAGFIGSELVHQLIARGFRVSVVDNLSTGKRENLAGLAAAGVELFVADIRDEESMASLLRNVDLVFHLACVGERHSIHSPLESHEVNASASLKLLHLARAAKVMRFVYVSSCEVYGAARTLPITEEHPTMPMTVHGASKLAGECYARAFWETYRYPTVVVRPFSSYGPRCPQEDDNGEVVSRLMLRCMAGQPMVVFGDGTQTRDFTYVSDIAAGILVAGISHHSVGHTINLASGTEIQIKELARMVAEVVGSTRAEISYAESRPADVPRLLANNSKARRLLKFESTVSLKEGLDRVAEWYTTLKKSSAA